MKMDSKAERPEQTDEEVAKRVQKGDGQAFGMLVDRYEGKMLRYAKKFIYDGEEAKDLVQDVFVKAYTNIQSFDSKRRFSPWIYRIAHNEFVNSLKRRSNSKVFSLDLDVLFPYPTSDDTADGEFQKKELRTILDKNLGRLDPKYREPLVLYYYEDMDYRNISSVLEVPVSTVGVRILRGKAMLKKLLAEQENYGTKQ